VSLGLNNYLGFTTHKAIQSIEITRVDSPYGFGIDNLVVGGEAIPEPSTVFLSVLAGAGLLAARRRVL